MTAAELRAAADRLDELAGAAIPDESAYGTYAAAMHPEVGKALAAWLRWEATYNVGTESRIAPPALTVARLILGGDA